MYIYICTHIYTHIRYMHACRPNTSIRDLNPSPFSRSSAFCTVFVRVSFYFERLFFIPFVYKCMSVQIYNHTYITFLYFSIYASNHMYRIYMYENQGAGKWCISAGIIPEKKISSTSRSPIENRQTAPAFSHSPPPPFPPAQHQQLIE